MATDKILNEEDVREVHQQQLALGRTNDHHIAQFVKMLGGIDSILDDYLSSENGHRLTQLQLQQIHELITSEDHQSDKPHLTFRFDTANSYIVSLFGWNIAIKILKVLNSWIPTVVHVMCLIICLLLVFLVPQKYPIPMVISLCICMCTWTPFAIMWWMGIDKKALKMIINSFEFWFKFGYAILYAIFSVIYCTNMFGWHMFIAIGISMKVIWITLYVSSFDGVNKSRFVKTLCSCIAATLLTILSLVYEFYMDDYIMNLSWNYSVSVTDKLSDSARVLALFLWKQTILTYWRPNRCVLIKHTPYIEWDTRTLTQMLTTDNTAYVKLNEITPSEISK